MKPSQYGNLSPFAYIGLLILFLLPDVGIIFAIIFAIFSRNKEVKNFSIAFIIIFILLYALVFVFLWALLGPLSDYGFEIDDLIPDTGSEQVTFRLAKFFSSIFH